MLSLFGASHKLLDEDSKTFVRAALADDLRLSGHPPIVAAPHMSVRTQLTARSAPVLIAGALVGFPRC